MRLLMSSYERRGTGSWASGSKSSINVVVWHTEQWNLVFSPMRRAAPQQTHLATLFAGRMLVELGLRDGLGDACTFRRSRIRHCFCDMVRLNGENATSDEISDGHNKIQQCQLTAIGWQHKPFRPELTSLSNRSHTQTLSATKSYLQSKTVCYRIIGIG